MASKENHISPWQSKALESGRAPLPNAPGERPWLDKTSRTKLSTEPVPGKNKRQYAHWADSETGTLKKLKKSHMS
ncbi:hypothetical protein S40285_02960 [Stachybotrys chlorohalonatus IBT 40285]|uniref:Uncharacterized protein n=1 Tax=Stachybotrys chlorohalonatus (strain IBT 40285) TaxID=1283841 RepID=A0A084QK73_STAC4|nr:hypothetical protein S40285_02960 [Stachybotrys chlorohalonata IBT 40285]